jgi:2-amino-4-hydroxy-6-hydroxymethyldihydropteridine diphosphokinase
MPEKTLYLSLGSNLGEREDRLAQALAALEREQVQIVARSSIYETEPQDIDGQPWFLNMAAECRTSLMPLQCMNLILRIEREIGRVRHAETQRGPRPIDIDILLFGHTVMDMPQLIVPHPRMLQRRFVLEPLLEIAPKLRHPVTHQPLREYLKATLNQQLRLKAP